MSHRIEAPLWVLTVVGVALDTLLGSAVIAVWAGLSCWVVLVVITANIAIEAIGLLLPA